MLLVRAGSELFALDLRDALEAVEMPEVSPVPAMRDGMLGVFPLRDELVPVYSPEGVLRLAGAGRYGVALVLRAGARRIAVALDDVDDVIQVDLTQLQRPSGLEAGDRVLLGVARYDGTLVSVVDAAALAAALVAAPNGEDA
jgi:chemotaxis signal transduction protein